MSWVDHTLDWVGRRLAGRHGMDYRAPPGEHIVQWDLAVLQRTLRPGDVLLVEGRDRISAAIKYLTQSTWSHAALYVGDALGPQPDGSEAHTLVEVNLGHGCMSAPLSKYKFVHTRICRPVNLTPDDRQSLVQFMIDRIGMKYDVRNVLDLARYLLPYPPVPRRFRRQMIALGSGEPTRAICSTLIAQAFQSIRYPILPRIERIEPDASDAGTGVAIGSEPAGTDETAARSELATSMAGYSVDEILHIRNHSLFAPRDFDASPFFQIVKPTIEEGFNYKGVVWADQVEAADPKETATADSAADSDKK